MLVKKAQVGKMFFVFVLYCRAGRASIKKGWTQLPRHLHSWAEWASDSLSLREGDEVNEPFLPL